MNGPLLPPAPRSCLNLLRGWKKLPHQPCVVGLEGIELLGVGGDEVCEGCEAAGDCLLHCDIGVRNGNAIEHCLVQFWLGYPGGVRI